MRYLPAILLLFCSLQCTAHADTTRLRAFIATWSEAFIDRPAPTCNQIGYWYGDRLNWYGQTIQRPGICAFIQRHEQGKIDATVTMIPIPDESLHEHWRVNLIDGYGISAYDDIYLIVEVVRDTVFKIIKESSVTYDNWLIHKQDITTDTISDTNGKTYFVLASDTTRFKDFGVYFLTDTLSFYESQHRGICGEEHASGFSTTGPVFVALRNKHYGELFSILDITKMVYDSSHEGDELLRGGFPCYVRGDANDSINNASFEWFVPEIFRWRNTGDRSEIFFSLSYIWASRCDEARIYVVVNEKRKELKVERKMIRPLGNPAKR